MVKHFKMPFKRLSFQILIKNKIEKFIIFFPKFSILCCCCCIEEQQRRTFYNFRRRFDAHLLPSSLIEYVRRERNRNEKWKWAMVRRRQRTISFLFSFSLVSLENIQLMTDRIKYTNDCMCLFSVYWGQTIFCFSPNSSHTHIHTIMNWMKHQLSSSGPKPDNDWYGIVSMFHGVRVCCTMGA